MNDQINSIAAILHIRQASECLKTAYPDLSNQLLSLAINFAEVFNVTNEQVNDMKELAKEISNNDSKS